MRTLVVLTLLVAGCSKPAPTAPVADLKPLADARAEAARWKKEAETNRAGLLKVQADATSTIASRRQLEADNQQLQASIRQLQTELAVAKRPRVEVAKPVDKADPIKPIFVGTLGLGQLEIGQVGEFMEPGRNPLDRWGMVAFRVIRIVGPQLVMLSHDDNRSLIILAQRPTAGDADGKIVFLDKPWQVLRTQKMGVATYFVVAPYTGKMPPKKEPVGKPGKGPFDK